MTCVRQKSLRAACLISAGALHEIRPTPQGTFFSGYPGSDQRIGSPLTAAASPCTKIALDGISSAGVEPSK
jgi:hypothetical protein